MQWDKNRLALHHLNSAKYWSENVHREVKLLNNQCKKLFLTQKRSPSWTVQKYMFISSIYHNPPKSAHKLFLYVPYNFKVHKQFLPHFCSPVPKVPLSAFFFIVSLDSPYTGFMVCGFIWIQIVPCSQKVAQGIYRIFLNSVALCPIFGIFCLWIYMNLVRPEPPESGTGILPNIPG